MNAIIEAPEHAISAATLEHVLGTGDLSRLSTQQRVEYYTRTCQSLGLNPMTRPFRFMNFQGQVVLYATRDAADQLRRLHQVNIVISDKQLDGDLFLVTVRATTKHGRTDEDVGAVVLGKLAGDARANAIMKAMTKAKRRVTLSICGLGFMDETEVETLQGVVTYDADAPAPEPPKGDLRDEINREVPLTPPKRTARAWLDELRHQVALCASREEVEALAGTEQVRKAQQHFRNGALEELNAIMADGMERFAADGADDADDDFPGDKP